MREFAESDDVVLVQLALSAIDEVEQQREHVMKRWWEHVSQVSGLLFHVYSESPGSILRNQQSRIALARKLACREERLEENTAVWTTPEHELVQLVLRFANFDRPIRV